MGEVKGDRLWVRESGESLGLDGWKYELGIFVLVKVGGREDGSKEG